MGWFNIFLLAEEIAEPEDGDGEGLSDKKAAKFCGISRDEWASVKHQGHLDAQEEGLLDERQERKERQGKSWW